MSSIKDLMHGDGRVDTALRALALGLFVAVAVALIWTTMALRRDAVALSPDPMHERTTISSTEKEYRP